MKWIRLRNKGSFDVIKAINLMGASVKVCDNPVGLYGSGSKFALGQALRQKINVKICCNGQQYTLIGVPEEFRGKMFEVVGFRTKTGKVIKTPITTDFGKEDWNDKFYILREFYSNLLDEGGEVHLTDGYEDYEEGFVDVYLPYNEFKEYVDNLDDYFNKQEHGTLKVGTGKVYKKSVYVGTIPDMKVDMWDDCVKITESRTMLLDSAESCLRDNLLDCLDEKVWQSFFESKKSGDIRIYDRTTLKEPIDKAFKAIYGEKYIICPNVQSILNNCVEEGFTPVVFSDKWDLKDLGLPNYLDKIRDIGCRSMNGAEAAMVDKALKAIHWIIGDRTFDIKVIENTELSRLGDANLSTGLIRLSQSSFNSFGELVRTVLEETSHVISKFGDYDRGFSAFFMDKIVEISI